MESKRGAVRQRHQQERARESPDSSAAPALLASGGRKTDNARRPIRLGAWTRPPPDLTLLAAGEFRREEQVQGRRRFISHFVWENRRPTQTASPRNWKVQILLCGRIGMFQRERAGQGHALFALALWRRCPQSLINVGQVSVCGEGPPHATSLRWPSLSHPPFL